MKRTRHSFLSSLFRCLFCLGLAGYLLACKDSNGGQQLSYTANNQAEAKVTHLEKDAATPTTVNGPKPGKWIATVSNGYKGDQLTFTVSADGKRIENVVFTGHWRSRSSRTEVLKHLDPPNPFIVNKDSFSAVQHEEKAGMWWEFIGRFTSATTAEGSYRCTFAGGENDTYKLKWTAKRVGS